MLAAVRRALGQASNSACRRLSTAVVHPHETGLLNSVRQAGQDSPVVSASLGAGLVGDLPSPFLTGIPPVYLQMSSLIRPVDSVDPSDELVELDGSVFAHPVRRDILHLCVVHHLDGQRQGTASTKTRGEVRGSGRKIRPQKGSGRARLGDGQSPMLRGGGVAFGPKPRDFATKLNRKVIQMGMRSALSARVKEQSLGIVKTLDWQGHKTQELAGRIDELGWMRTLFVTGMDEIPEGLARASGNLKGVDTVTAGDLTVYDALKWPRLILDLPAVEWFEQVLGKKPATPRPYDI